MAGFLLFRYGVVAVALIGIGWTLRSRSAWPGVAMVTALGVATWIFTVAPLEQPYALQPGTDVSFDHGLVSASAARGEVLASWVVDRASPRPLWGLLWHGVAPGDPVRARTLLTLFPVVLFVILPVAVYRFARRMGLDVWVAVSTTFAAVLAASLQVDADSPFSLFHRGVFFATPSRGLALALALVSLELAWSRRSLASAIALGALVWLDAAVSVWVMISVIVGEVLTRARCREGSGGGTYVVLALGAAAWVGRWFLYADGEALSRVPTAAEVIAIKTAFLDIGFVTLDMRLVFVFAAVGTFVMWRQAGASELRIVSMLTAAYVMWAAGAVAFRVHPFPDTDALFHLVRFNAAFVAGVGAFELCRTLVECGLDSSKREGIRRWAARLGSRPLAFAVVVVVLLPESAPFVWRPAMFDPLYYPSTYEWDESVRRLERWMLEQSDADTVVLTGDETGEWIAALTGRRVVSGVRVLGRDEARQHRRRLRQLFLSSEPSEMHSAFDALGADILVLDPELREVYWELDERLLESSGLVRRAHQIGDRYTIYVRRVTPARAEGDASIRGPQCHDNAGLVWNRLCSAKSRSSALVHNSDRGREFAWPRLPSSDHLAIKHPERRHGVENLAPDPCLDSLCRQPSRSHR